MPRFNMEIPYGQIPWEYYLSFVGQSAAHNPYIYHVISEVLKEREVHSIVELGTYHGALTVYLGLWGAKLGIPVYTFDIEPNLHESVKPVFDKLGIEFFELDDMTDEGLKKIIECVDDKPTYLICDGGNKQGEFLRYFPIVPVGSMLSVHDFLTEGDPTVWERLSYPNERVRPDLWMYHDVRFATYLKIGQASEKEE